MSEASVRGQFLVSNPGLLDPNFHRTVVLMIDHTEDGAFGLVINRPIGKTIAELWKEILKDETTCRSAVHWGGPVDGQLMVLHSIRALADAEILPGVYLSTTKTNVDSVIESDPPHSRFFIGYAGWSAGQLETEIEEGAWEVVPASVPEIFGDADLLWPKLTQSADSLPTQLGIKQIPSDPELN